MAMGSAIIIKLNDNVLCFLFPTLETSSFIVNLLEGQNTDDISIKEIQEEVARFSLIQ